MSTTKIAADRHRKLTKAQEALLLAVKKDNADGRGHYCVEHYRPSMTLVERGFVERRQGAWSSSLWLTDSGKALLRELGYNVE